MPGREDFWNIGYPLLGILSYTVLIVALVSIGYGFRQRYRIWRLGKPMPDLGPWGPRFGRVLKLATLDILGHRRFIKGELYPGLMHFFLFWGIIFLFMATTVTFFEFSFHKYLPVEFPTTRFRVQEDFVWDVFGGLFTAIGLSMAAFRCYVLRPPRLNTFLDDGMFLLFIGGMLLTGFMIEGLRIAGTDPSPVWAAPVGYVFSLPFANASQDAIEVIHKTFYWVHVVILAVAFAYTGAHFSKISHIFFSPANAFLRSDRPLGALRSMGDMETLERFGAGDIADFTWKQMLDFDACTNCGRCQDQCPAYLSGKVLSPRKIIQDLRNYATERAPALLSLQPGQEPPAPATGMIPYVEETAVWDCVTCRACMEACPVFIEHIDSIVDMRRYMVMEQSEMPEGAQGALVNLEQRGHPWRGTQATRTDWMEGTNVTTLADDSDVELLLWVGCTSALNEINQPVPRAMASLLKTAGIKFGVLGAEETCTGDPARRMGNEYLFQMLAEQTIETLNGYNVKKIVTLCPHCFNTIKNEYPQLGGNYE
ncbi:MAG: (Fe-S)-binding protein, partial [Dehalococcoidia bacterium]